MYESLFSVFLQLQILDNIRSSDLFALMTDESTDLAVLMQLVLVAMYMIEEGKTSFLLIQDIQDRRAQTIEMEILKCRGEKSLDITRLHGIQ